MKLRPRACASRPLPSDFFESAGFDEVERTAGLSHARFVTASGTDDATALAVAGLVVNLLSKDYEAALSAIERALSLNGSCAAALYFGALIYAFAGRPAAAVSNANRALRLSPFDPAIFQAHLALGLAALRRRSSRPFRSARAHFAASNASD